MRSPDDNEAIVIRHNVAARRFEAEIAGQLAMAEYRLESGQIILSRTFVPGQYRGRGIGEKLVRAALEMARQRELKAVAECSYAVKFMRTF